MVRILVVEDNDINREMLTRRLERKGFEVFIALDGKEGVSKAAEIIPDCILMDINMPVMDGFEATGLLKADDALKSIPVIALTAYALGEDEDKCLEAGCDAYLPKPLDFKMLLSKMAEMNITSGGTA